MIALSHCIMGSNGIDYDRKKSDSPPYDDYSELNMLFEGNS